MIAGILVAALVVLLAGAWLFVETITYLHAGTRAFNRYTDTHPADISRPAPVHPPTDPSGSPHSVWRTKGSRQQ